MLLLALVCDDFWCVVWLMTVDSESEVSMSTKDC